jgi:transcriptional regulator with XRE-family HTH domain
LIIFGINNMDNTMTINLRELIEQRGLRLQEVAEILFPDNRFPRAALNRVLNGKTLLNSEQVSRLAAWLGVSVDNLYRGAWNSEFRGETCILTNGNYRAELSVKTGETKVFHLGSLFHETVLHDPAIPLSKYIELLNTIIKNHQANESRN